MSLFGSKSSKQALCFSSTKHFQSPYHKTQYQIIIRIPFSYQANVVNLEHKLHHPDIMLQAQPLISVIVPVYKAEAYLHRCVDSLVAQTLKNIEILLINDGSPDQSGAICDEYAQRYPFIKAFHKTNEGLNATLELGIQIAKGEYSIQVDPDDWVEPDMLEQMYQKAKLEDADMVICDFIIIKQKGIRHSIQRPSNLSAETVIKEILTIHHGSGCNKLVRNKLYSQYNIHHPKGFSQCEDLYVTLSLLSHNIRVSYIPKGFYHYDQTINSNSIIKNYNAETLQKDLLMFKAFDSLSQSLGANRLTCLQQMSQLIVSRAMKGGFLNSAEFAKTFAFTIPFIASNPRLKKIRKIKFIMSCRGYYFLFRPFILIAHKIRRLF